VVSILLLIFIIASELAQSQENQTANRQEAFRRIVQSYVQAGKGEYDKGYYEQALKTFVMAQGYQEYLTAAEREELNAHLEKTREAVAKRKLALEKFQTANKLIKQNNLLEARTNLESIKKDEYLTQDEHAQIAAMLRQIDIQISNKTTPQITAEEPEQTEIKEETPKPEEEPAPDEKKNPEMIAVIGPKVFNFEATESEVNEPKPVEPKPADKEAALPAIPEAPAKNVTATSTNNGSYIEQINKKRNILRTYTGTVVNNAIAKASSYMNQGQFDKAKKEIEDAEFTVKENQIHLGDALFKEYTSKLKALSDEIVEKQNQKAQQDEKEKREAAIEAQNQFRKQMEIDRQKRISDLMKNALAYQEQQQYEAALGQLQSLLALDPQNNEALILRDTLEDMIDFRKQLEVQKETNRQKADILLKTEQSGIPYAEELTYPKNWREIIQKPTRQKDQPIGLDPIDVSVYERLEQAVDLSSLTPAMSFADVITALKNSVEPPLQIQPNWKDLLENAELEPTTRAGMDPLTGVKLRKALEVLLAGVSSETAEIDYVVDEGVILIATVDTLPKKLETRVYDITDLVGEPAQYGGMQGMMMGRMMGMMSGGGMGGGMGGLGGGVGGRGGGGGG